MRPCLRKREVSGYLCLTWLYQSLLSAQTSTRKPWKPFAKCSESGNHKKSIMERLIKSKWRQGRCTNANFPILINMPLLRKMVNIKESWVKDIVHGNPCTSSKYKIIPCGRQNNAPWHAVHFLIPRIFEYVRFCGKEKLTLWRHSSYSSVEFKIGRSSLIVRVVTCNQSESEDQMSERKWLQKVTEGQSDATQAPGTSDLERGKS